MKSLQVCPEHSALLSMYQQAALNYSDAITTLNRNVGICPKDRYDTFYRLASETNTQAYQARTRLDEHIAKHGC